MSMLLVLVLAAGIDQGIYEDIRYGWNGSVQDVVAEGVSIMTNYPALAVADVGLGLSGDEKLRRVSRQAFVSWVGATGVMLGLRAVVKRPRPEHDKVNWWNSSFPSGHTTGYFAMATVYAARYPKLKWPLFFTGILVGFSRIYLGEHYPSDVLAGAGLGTGLGALTLRVWPERGQSTSNRVRLVSGNQNGRLCAGVNFGF